MTSSPPLPQRLFRGASDSKVEKDGGLCPPSPGKPFSSGFAFGQKHPDGQPLTWGSGLVWGASPINEVLFHQHKGQHKTSGISTSPKREVAERYARGRNGISSGVVYELDVEKLIELGCSVFRVNDHVTDPAEPGDDEHTVVAPDFGAIPVAAIVGSFKVGPSG